MTTFVYLSSLCGHGLGPLQQGLRTSNCLCEFDEVWNYAGNCMCIVSGFIECSHDGSWGYTQTTPEVSSASDTSSGLVTHFVGVNMVNYNTAILSEWLGRGGCHPVDTRVGVPGTDVGVLRL